MATTANKASSGNYLLHSPSMCVCPYVCIHIYVGVCAHVQVRMERPDNEVGCLPQFLYTYFLRLSLSLNPQITYLAREAGQQAPEDPLTPSPAGIAGLHGSAYGLTLQSSLLAEPSPCPHFLFNPSFPILVDMSPKLSGTSLSILQVTPNSYKWPLLFSRVHSPHFSLGFPHPLLVFFSLFLSLSLTHSLSLSLLSRYTQDPRPPHPPTAPSLLPCCPEPFFFFS